MYNPVIMDKMSAEQNRRIREQQSIAQAWNQVERKPLNLLRWLRSIFAGFSRKQKPQFGPAGDISQLAEAQRE